jgi:hypothetical protein
MSAAGWNVPVTTIAASGKCDATDNQSIVPMAMAAPRPATAPSAALRKPMRRHSFLAASRHSRLTAKQKGGRSLCRPASLERTTYFRLVIAVRSAENFTTPVGLHQLEPNPPGLIAVTKDGLKLVVL